MRIGRHPSHLVGFGEEKIQLDPLGEEVWRELDAGRCGAVMNPGGRKRRGRSEGRGGSLQIYRRGNAQVPRKLENHACCSLRYLRLGCACPNREPDHGRIRLGPLEMTGATQTCQKSQLSEDCSTQHLFVLFVICRGLKPWDCEVVTGVAPGPPMLLVRLALSETNPVSHPIHLLVANF